MDKIEIDVDKNLYHHIDIFNRIIAQFQNNIGPAINRLTILWILTLIIYWFK